MASPIADFDMTNTNEPDEVELEWQKWSQKPDPVAFRGIVSKFDDTIDKTVARFGKQAGATTRGKARLLVAKAVRSYNPSAGAKLRTHVNNHLKSLQRAVPMLSDPMPIPERMRLEHTRLQNLSLDYEDEVGRPPTDDELAEMSGVSLKKIQRMRKAVRGHVPFSVIEEADDDDESGMATDVVASQRSDYDTWMDAVYAELGEIDKLIMRYKSGYGGEQVVDNNEIAKRLNLHPSTVSQRAARIQQRLDAYHGGT